jgi:hypothetical protein
MTRKNMAPKRSGPLPGRHSFDQGVKGKSPRAEGQHQQGGQEKWKWRGCDKLVGIAENAHERLVIGRHIGGDHDESDGNRHGARSEADDQQQTSETFGGAGEVGVDQGHRDIETAEKLRRALDVEELPFSREEELPEKIEPQEEHQGRLQVICADCQPLVKAADGLIKAVHFERQNQPKAAQF